MAFPTPDDPADRFVGPFSPLPCQAWHGYVTFIAHNGEVREFRRACERTPLRESEAPPLRRRRAPRIRKLGDPRRHVRQAVEGRRARRTDDRLARRDLRADDGRALRGRLAHSADLRGHGLRSRPRRRGPTARRLSRVRA
jgi:hypothetical protein